MRTWAAACKKKKKQMIIFHKNPPYGRENHNARTRSAGLRHTVRYGVRYVGHALSWNGLLAAMNGLGRPAQ